MKSFLQTFDCGESFLEYCYQTDKVCSSACDLTVLPLLVS